MNHLVRSIRVRQITNHSGCRIRKNRTRQLVLYRRITIGKHQAGSGLSQSVSNAETESLSSTRDQNRSPFQLDIQVNRNSRIWESNSSAAVIEPQNSQGIGQTRSVASRNQRDE